MYAQSMTLGEYLSDGHVLHNLQHVEMLVWVVMAILRLDFSAIRLQG